MVWTTVVFPVPAYFKAMATTAPVVTLVNMEVIVW